MNPDTNTETPATPQLLLPEVRKRVITPYIYSVIALLILVTFFTFFVSRAPTDFPAGRIISIPQSATLSEVALILKKESVIRSSDAFKVTAFLYGAEYSAMAGDYLFAEPLPVWSVAHRIARGDQGLSRIKVTFPEGTNVREMAVILAKQISAFDTASFVAAALPVQGYLFPDTYFFFPNVKPDEVIRVMRAEFEQKYKLLINNGKRTQADIVNMASIVEKEANNSEDWRIVAGILWKRIDNSMPLQVDAPFLYTVGKASKDLTSADLKVDSPYNTYIHRGLPKGPIDNPGAGALQASLTPSSTAYWYYLSDEKGVMHYAKTYEGHLDNKVKYLK